MQVPLATYRIQLNPAFGFRAAAAVVSYLAELGVSHLYGSPIFKARAASPHGYDLVDPNRLNPDLGSESDFDELTKKLAAFGMGWLQDIVPNHMAFHHENSMLMDILENGRASDYFNFFDIDWQHPYEGMRGRLLAPFLGTFFGEALERGEIRLTYGREGLRVTYYDRQFPLRIESYATFFTHRLSALRSAIGSDHPDFTKLLGIIYVLKNLPGAEERAERNQQIVSAKRMLWDLYERNQEIRCFVDQNIALFNGRPGEPASFNLLDELLSRQLFRLAFWKVATEEINYRRFFNINELICLNTEQESVFDHTQELIFRLVRSGKFSGLRIDHIDGLYDPGLYLNRLRERLGEIYLVVEKILGPGEELPSHWPVQGTTGYDFLNCLNGIYCKKENEKKFSRIYARFARFSQPYAELLYEKKKLILAKHMAGDIDNLARLLKLVSSRDRHGGDITLYGLKMALVEVMALFPIYRTYISGELIRPQDRLYLKEAVSRALGRNPGLLHELELIKGFLLLDFGSYLSEEEKRRWFHFVMRFQQFTGPLMAKGLEDTTLYIYNRLLALNEVGGSPERFGFSLAEFHDFNEKRAASWPHSLSTTSTHDTKRGEDVRARLNVLSELPEQWEVQVKKWHRINRKHKRRLRGLRVPERNDEYFLYQTLVGAFPFAERDHPAFVGRLKDYIIKAVREAKIHTAWLKPDQEYEEAYLSFVDRLLEPAPTNQFLREFLPFQKKISHYGVLNSLSQTLVKITSPGVPDFYQGTELWDLNLVDPDNRRLVDFAARRRLLQEIKAGLQRARRHLIAELLQRSEDGRIKLFLIHLALRARWQYRELFQQGSYVPLEVAGKHRAHVLSFARSCGEARAVTVAPRFLVELVGEKQYPLGRDLWQDTRVKLPAGWPQCWQNQLTGEEICGQGSLLLGDLLQLLPVALLVGGDRAEGKFPARPNQGIGSTAPPK